MDDETNDDSKVAVDVRALSVDGYDCLYAVPQGHLLLLEEPTLGMKAGYLRAHWGYGWGSYPAPLRELVPVTPERAQELIGQGTPVHAARRSADWNSDFPVLVRGLRLGELRAALANIDLPDDAIVAIGSATHPQEFISSPAAPRVEVGFYEPDPANGTYGYAAGGAPDLNEDGNVPLHLPALVLNPTH